MWFHLAIKNRKHIDWRKMDGTGNYCVKQNRLDSERQTSHVPTHMWDLEKNKGIRVEGKC